MWEGTCLLTLGPATTPASPSPLYFHLSLDPFSQPLPETHSGCVMAQRLCVWHWWWLGAGTRLVNRIRYLLADKAIGSLPRQCSTPHSTFHKLSKLLKIFMYTVDIYQIFYSTQTSLKLAASEKIWHTESFACSQCYGCLCTMWHNQSISPPLKGWAWC